MFINYMKRQQKKLMAWLESHTVLIRHRKLLELARRLNIPSVYALGHLHSLWYSVLEQQEDGNLSKWSDELIAEMAQYKGKPDIFVSSLVQYGWLDGRIIHDWLDYAGRYLTGKYRNSNPKKLKEIYKLHKTGFRRSLGSKETDNLPNHTKPNQTNHTKPNSLLNQKLFPFLKDSTFLKTFNDFLDMRKSIKKRATDHAQNLILKKLHHYDIKTAIGMLEQSIEGSWTGIYEIKNIDGLHLTKAQKQTQASYFKWKEDMRNENNGTKILSPGDGVTPIALPKPTV